MKKVLFLYPAGLSIFMIFCMIACKKETTQDEPKPTIQVTGEIIVVEQSVAKIGGTVSAMVKEVGACWDTLENPNVAKNKVTGTQNNGKFSVYASQLLSNKQYFARTYALDNNGNYFYSENLSFKTKQAPPAATTLAASSVGLHEAVLNGKIFLPQDSTLSWWFEYGESTTYGNKTQEQNITTSGLFVVSSPITELDASKTYHFKLNMRINNQVFSGSDQSFTTPGGKPSIVSWATDNEQLDKIIITAIINPNLFATTVTIEWYDGVNLESMTLNQVLEGGSNIEITTEIPVSRAQQYTIGLKATNALGQTNSNYVSLISLALIDMHGNKFHACKIGNQYWLTANWRVLNYNNGDPIPNITEPVAWGEQTQGALCFFNNDQQNYQIYGPLYNWYVISDPRGICPPGWHVPTYDEWWTLTQTLGGNGGRLKEAGFEHWFPSNEGGNNSTGFTGLPGGERGQTNFNPTPENKGTFVGINTSALFWSSESTPNPNASWHAYLEGTNAGLWVGGSGYKYYGHSIRLIKD